jgi:hypothetical protein
LYNSPLVSEEQICMATLTNMNVVTDLTNTYTTSNNSHNNSFLIYGITIAMGVLILAIILVLLIEKFYLKKKFPFLYENQHAVLNPDLNASHKQKVIVNLTKYYTFPNDNEIEEEYKDLDWGIHGENRRFKEFLLLVRFSILVKTSLTVGNLTLQKIKIEYHAEMTNNFNFSVDATTENTFAKIYEFADNIEPLLESSYIQHISNVTTEYCHSHNNNSTTTNTLLTIKTIILYFG